MKDRNIKMLLNGIDQTGLEEAVECLKSCIRECASEYGFQYLLYTTIGKGVWQRTGCWSIRGEKAKT